MDLQHPKNILFITVLTLLGVSLVLTAVYIYIWFRHYRGKSIGLRRYNLPFNHVHRDMKTDERIIQDSEKGEKIQEFDGVNVVQMQFQSNYHTRKKSSFHSMDFDRSTLGSDSLLSIVY